MKQFNTTFPSKHLLKNWIVTMRKIISLALLIITLLAFAPGIAAAQNEPFSSHADLLHSPSPADRSGEVDAIVTFSWEGAAGYRYDLYLEAGDLTPDELIASDQTETTFGPILLDPHTNYSWKVVMRDQKQVVQTSPVWNFTTRAWVPYVPSHPVPASGTQHQALMGSLSWVGGDPSSEIVRYDVYLEAGDSSPDTLVSDDQIETTYTTGLLLSSATYYWQIVAKNTRGKDTAGPVWSFTTANDVVIPGEMVLIPGGSFQVGCPPDSYQKGACTPDENFPFRSVSLNAYLIDKYEVTNAQYARCVADGKCDAPFNTASPTRASYYDNPLYVDYPVMNVSWENAADYCAWAGKRLPTEVEWEAAARGSDSTQAYPWGQHASNCTLANGASCLDDSSTVGSYPAGASPYGVMDMSGNVWEWVADHGSGAVSSSSPFAFLTGSTARALRGGSWSSDHTTLRIDQRNTFSTGAGAHPGFRCAETP